MQTLGCKVEHLEQGIRRVTSRPKPWTTEETESLFALVADGKTFSEIEAIIGRRRNACLGRYHRELIKRGHVPNAQKRILEGLASKPKQFGRDTVQKRQYTPTRALPDVPKDGVGFLLPAIPAPAPRTGPAKGILDVTGCKWPVEHDPSVIGSHAFCDAEKKDGSPYCAFHAAKAFVPVKPLLKAITPIGLRFQRRAA